AAPPAVLHVRHALPARRAALRVRHGGPRPDFELEDPGRTSGRLGRSATPSPGDRERGRVDRGGGGAVRTAAPGEKGSAAPGPAAGGDSYSSESTEASSMARDNGEPDSRPAGRQARNAGGLRLQRNPGRVEQRPGLDLRGGAGGTQAAIRPKRRLRREARRGGRLVRGGTRRRRTVPQGARDSLVRAVDLPECAPVALLLSGSASS